mgnify:CR=1 FL=1
MQWEGLRQATGYQVDLPSDISSDMIDSYLSRGIYPIVRVRMYALGNQEGGLPKGNHKVCLTVCTRTAYIPFPLEGIVTREVTI